jgi:hypothetical protein
MENKLNIPLSYNKRTPEEIMMFTEMIENVYYLFDNARWSNNTHAEIGFYVKDKLSKTTLFFGIWFEAWKSYGIPMSIVIDYYGKDVTSRMKDIKQLIDNKTDKGLLFYPDYHSYGLILFEHIYYNFTDDETRIFQLLNQVKFKLNMVTSS